MDLFVMAPHHRRTAVVGVSVADAVVTEPRTWLGRGVAKTVPAIASARGGGTAGGRRQRRRESFIAWLFLLPTLVGLGIFIFYPLTRS
jgi:hypothetical protein